MVGYVLFYYTLVRDGYEKASAILEPFKQKLRGNEEQAKLKISEAMKEMNKSKKTIRIYVCRRRINKFTKKRDYFLTTCRSKKGRQNLGIHPPGFLSLFKPSVRFLNEEAVPFEQNKTYYIDDY